MSRTGFFLIWSYHLTQRSQWPDFKVRHTVYQSCTSWQRLMTLGMIVFKLWSGHEADRWTDGHDRHTIIRPVIDRCTSSIHTLSENILKSASVFEIISAQFVFLQNDGQTLWTLYTPFNIKSKSSQTHRQSTGDQNIAQSNVFYL
jgi:hypothetical protein